MKHSSHCACGLHSALVQYANCNSVYGKIALIFAGPEDNQSPNGNLPNRNPKTHFPMQILCHLTPHTCRHTAHRCQYLSVFCLIKTFCQYFKRGPSFPLSPVLLWPAVAIVSAFVFIDNMQMSRFVCAGNANPMHMKYLSQTITPESERELGQRCVYAIKLHVYIYFALPPSLLDLHFSWPVCNFRGFAFKWK